MLSIPYMVKHSRRLYPTPRAVFLRVALRLREIYPDLPLDMIALNARLTYEQGDAHLAPPRPAPEPLPLP